MFRFASPRGHLDFATVRWNWFALKWSPGCGENARRTWQIRRRLNVNQSCSHKRLAFRRGKRAIAKAGPGSAATRKPVCLSARASRALQSTPPALNPSNSVSCCLLMHSLLYLTRARQSHGYLCYSQYKLQRHCSSHQKEDVRSKM